MLINKLMIFVLMYFTGLLIFCLKSKHVLLMLLSLEFIILSMYMGIYFCLTIYFYEYSFVIIFLTLMICESSLGLGILVSMIRSYGNDYFNSLNILW